MKYFVERLKDKKAIAAWEIGNESRLIAKTEHHDTPEFWLTYMHDIIRRADPTRPVIGPDGLNLACRTTQPHIPTPSAELPILTISGPSGASRSARH